MSESIRRNSLPFKPSQLLRDDNLDIRHAILHGPILLTMLRLAWPTILVLVAQVAVGVAEIFYVSFLGTTALAGVALVFPLVMLMTIMSNGALGGGVGSAIARAIGARRMDDADALTFHALIVAIVFGLIFYDRDLAIWSHHLRRARWNRRDSRRCRDLLGIRVCRRGA